MTEQFADKKESWTQPSWTFSDITFSDGNTISFNQNDIVLIVGPNNSGKSETLRELMTAFNRNPDRRVTLAATLCRQGNKEDVEHLLQKIGTIVNEGTGSAAYQGYNFSISFPTMQNYEANLFVFAPVFAIHVTTISRLSETAAAPQYDALGGAPSHPFQFMHFDEKIEEKISGYFHKAFGQDLIVYRGGGTNIPLLVGKRPERENDEERTSRSYLNRVVAQSKELDKQGDGIRAFATVITRVLCSDWHTLFLVDEPEAFLHPPQARLLGTILAKDRYQNSQLFVATHSGDFLQGALDAHPANIKIIRISRDGDINKVKLLDNKKTAQIVYDPLLKYSGVLEGVFHKHVVVCEGDGDCLFYKMLLDLPEVKGDTQPDTLFIHANGKSRMARLVDALSSLGVPTSVIADIDVLNDEAVLSSIIIALGGDWANFSVEWKKLMNIIDQQKPAFNPLQIATFIQKQLENLPAQGDFPSDRRKKISEVFKNVSRWQSLKRNGPSDLPSGQAQVLYKSLSKAFNALGLWIVPVGEIEGFCRDIEAPHGGGWVRKVLEERDISTDQQFSGAREFMCEIHSRIAS